MVCFHTAGDMLNDVLGMDKTKFNTECILGDLIAIKERKLLSLDRKSRQEIVEISRRPDESSIENRRQENFVKRLFTPQPK